MPPLILDDFHWDEEKDYGCLSCGLSLSASPFLYEHQSIDKIRSIFAAINSIPTNKNMHIFTLQTKGVKDADILLSADMISALCHEYSIVFLLEDRVDLLQQTRADGIYISSRSISTDVDYIRQCRKQLGDEAIIGINCGNNKQDAVIAAEEEKVDFIAFESFFPSPYSKEMAGKASPELLSWWSTYSSIPALAKGHITPENAAFLIHEGIDFLCCDAFIWTTEDPVRATIDILKTITQTLMVSKIH